MHTGPVREAQLINLFLFFYLYLFCEVSLRAMLSFGGLTWSRSHSYTHLESAQYNHSLFGRALNGFGAQLEQLELRALLKGHLSCGNGELNSDSLTFTIWLCFLFQSVYSCIFKCLCSMDTLQNKVVKNWWRNTESLNFFYWPKCGQFYYIEFYKIVFKCCGCCEWSNLTLEKEKMYNCPMI